MIDLILEMIKSAKNEDKKVDLIDQDQEFVWMKRIYK